MKFALFFLGEYTHVITISFLTTILFFGGWHFPWIATPESAYAGAWLVKLGVLHTKVLCVILFIMLIRWTIPRFRFDQLMNIAWKVLIPLALGNVVAIMFIKQFNLSMWWSTVSSIALFVIAGMISTVATQKSLQQEPASGFRGLIRLRSEARRWIPQPIRCRRRRGAGAGQPGLACA